MSLDNLTKRTEETTPLKIIRDRFKKSKDGREMVVLLTTGSLNPVHKVHIQLTKMIARELETKYNLNVLGAFLSPSQYGYVHGKLGSDVIANSDRGDLIKLSIKDAGLEDFLFLDTWESKQSFDKAGFLDYYEIADFLREYIYSQLSKDVRVIYCCGYDHIQKLGCFMLRKKEKGVGVLMRYKYGEKASNNIANDENVYVVENNNKELKFNFSSSAIRDAIKKKDVDSLRRLMYPSAVEYICKMYNISK